MVTGAARGAPESRAGAAGAEARGWQACRWWDLEPELKFDLFLENLNCLVKLVLIIIAHARFRRTPFFITTQSYTQL